MSLTRIFLLFFLIFVITSVRVYSKSLQVSDDSNKCGVNTIENQTTKKFTNNWDFLKSGWSGKLNTRKFRNVNEDDKYPNIKNIYSYYLVQYTRKFAPENKINLDLENYQSRHKYHEDTRDGSHSKILPREKSYLFPYVDKSGLWQVKNLTRQEMFTKQYKLRPRRDFKIHFYLYTRKNPGEKNDIHDEEKLKNSSFSNKDRTVFIIHGWQSGEDKSETFPKMRKAYLQAGNYNVFMVDWPEPASDANYFVAAEFVQKLGKKVATFIKLLVNKGGASYKKIKIVGHSLGAHAAGVAGKNLEGKVSSIVGLDPAGLMFDEEGAEDKRLNRSDAKYVEVGHSSIVGFFQPIGHVDYYFNLGSHQPACYLPQCSHSIINEYFVESINNRKGFELEECKSLEDLAKDHCGIKSKKKRYMTGCKPDRSLKGIFNIKTRAKPPYAMNNG